MITFLRTVIGLGRGSAFRPLPARKARSVVTDRFLNDYWKERYRLTITISGNIMASTVKVRSQLQQKPRGGSAAYRWQRMKSTGEIEEEVLRRVEELLEEG